MLLRATAICLLALLLFKIFHKNDDGDGNKDYSIVPLDSVVIKNHVESLLRQRCENASYDVHRCDSTKNTYWDFEDGEKGYPHDKDDEEWDEIRRIICGEGSDFEDEEYPQVSSTTLLNRKSEVPYALPPEFLLICAAPTKTTTTTTTIIRNHEITTIAGAMFQNHTVRLLRRFTTSRIFNVPDETWLWSMDRQGNIIISSVSAKTSFRKPLETDILSTFEISKSSRCYDHQSIRLRTYNKHADLMPRWGCSVKKSRRGMFRGHFRLAGELFVHAGRWHLDPDSSFSYYRSSSTSYSQISKALQYVKSMILSPERNAVSEPVSIHVFEKARLFPNDDHISFDEKKKLIMSYTHSSSLDWPRGHRFECFPNAMCVVLDRIGHGSSGTVYRVIVSLIRGEEGEGGGRRRQQKQQSFSLYDFENIVMKVFHRTEEKSVHAAHAEATACLHINARFHPLLQQCLWFSENRSSVPLLFSQYVNEARDLDSELPISDWSVLTSAAEALDVIHQRGVIHNDVNPRNILITSERSIIVDFGLAAPIESARRETYRSPIYSRAYASPEQHAPFFRPRSDGKSDVWSFALTMLHAWHGSLIWVPIVGESYEWNSDKVDRVLAMRSVNEDAIPSEILNLLRTYAFNGSVEKTYHGSCR